MTNEPQVAIRPPHIADGGDPARHRLGRRAAGTVLVALFAVTAAVACSKADSSTNDVASLAANDPGTTQPAEAGGSDEAKALAFAKCMRDNGVPNFPDPKTDAQGNVQIGGFRDSAQNGQFDPQSQAFRDAMDKCRPLAQGLRGFGGNPADRAKFQDAALKYAQCLRDKGITVKDPDFTNGPPGGGGNRGQGGNGGQGGQGAQGGGGNDGGPRGAGGRGFITRALGLDQNDPAVQAAMDACQPVLQQALADAGITPPGGAPGGGNAQPPAGQ